MKKNTLLIILFLFASRHLFCENEQPRNYDVISYDLKLDWVDILPSTSEQPELRKWKGEVTIKLTPKDVALDTIEFDAVGLDVSLVSYNDLPIDLIEIISTPSLYKIATTESLKVGDTAVIVLKYIYNNPTNRGFFHRNTLNNSTLAINALVDIPSAATLNEQINARYWFPCNDRPSDKAIFNVAIKVPFGYEAFSNGTHDSTIISDDNTIATSYWSNAHPMPTYLFTACASIYDKHIDRMAINSTTQDSIDVYYWTWEDDWEGNATYNFSRMIEPTADIMKLYSDLFGDYAFEKYGVGEVDFALIGQTGLGMEHQTITTTSRSWYRNYLNVKGFTAFAHELGHHWIGNLVTCNTWQDLWWNEGGASWLEAIYLENIYTPNNRQRYYGHVCNLATSYINKADTILSCYSTPIYELSDEDGIFENGILVYQKASNIFATLREIIGDDVFPLFRELLDKYRFGNISTEQFIDYWTEKILIYAPDIDARKMFEQKIYNPGHPIYKMEVEQNYYAHIPFYDVEVRLTQIQKEIYPDVPNLPEQFATYMEILFYDADNNIVHREHRFNNKLEDTLQVTLNSPIAFVRLNDSVSLHQVKDYNFVGIEDENLENTINVFPNPTNSTLLNIKFDNLINTVQLIDMTGKVYDFIPKTTDNIKQIDINGIPKGQYIVNINGKYRHKIIIQ